MKKRFLIGSTLLAILPDLAQAQMPDRKPGDMTRPAPPPGRPGGPAIQPPRPGHGGPGVRPPHPQPPRPPKPPRPVRPHRPGAGRPPQFRPVHGRPFHYPRGYSYRRWSIGLILPRLFLTTAYYYGSYASMGLEPPPPGYRWVRYGPDLLLVQTRTGRIADVIYGAFY